MDLEEESKSRKLDSEKYITRTSERQMRTYEKNGTQEQKRPT
jgi:hypothetical protein